MLRCALHDRLMLIPFPMRLLFICSQNKWRSLTAERLFDNHPHHEARSAGTEPGAGCV